MSAVGDMMQRLQDEVAKFAAAKPSPADAPPKKSDLLAAALTDIAAHYGYAASPVALVAGLPLVEGRLPAEHVGAAARRAGLFAELSEGRVSELTQIDLPAIVLGKDGSADILWAWKAAPDGATRLAVLSEPGSPMTRVEVGEGEAAAAASGRVIRIRPASTLDERGESAIGQNKASWFLPAFMASKHIYAEAIAATVALNLLALALPMFTMNVYDRVLPNAVEVTLWALAIGATIATLFDLLIKTLRANYVDIASRRADVVLSNYIYGRLLGARLPDRPVSAGVRANALREFETLREFFNSATLTAFGDVPFILFFLGMIWVIAGPMAWIPTAAVPIILIAGWLTQRTLARLSENSFRETAQKNAIVVETVAGLESVKAAGAESWAAAKWETAVSEHIRSSHQIRHISTLGINIIFAIQTVTQILMVVAGFYLVAAGSMTTGALIAGTMLAGRALQPLGQIASLIARLHQTRLAFKALTDIVDQEQERPEGARLLTKTTLSGGITVENVSFSYEEGAPPSLVDVSFDIKPGERVCIAGAIGSGKTTLLKLMHALHISDKGRILVDGVPVNQIDPALLRANIGLGLQGADLFHGTIRSNITLADPGASDDAVMGAARAAGALDWIMRLPKGLDTPVRERGAGLSGGQRQSVALARALFRKPPLLLLDEPTSDMDMRSEKVVIDSLKTHLSGHTLIVVSHRPALLALVDRMIVLDHGRKIVDAPKAEALRQLEAMVAERTKAQQTTVPAVGTPPAPAQAAAPPPQPAKAAAAPAVKPAPVPIKIEAPPIKDGGKS